MLDEDEKLHGIYLKEETKNEQQRMEEEAREHREQEIDATCPSLRTVFGFHATRAHQLLSKPCEGSSTLIRPDTLGSAPDQSWKLMQ